MQKEIFVAPNPEICKSIVNSLRELGVDEEHIGVLAKDSLPIDDLPEADDEDKNDAIAGAKRGAAFGGAAGLFAGLGIMVVAPAGIAIGGAGLALAAVGGATYGTFVSTMIGASVPNSQLREYEDYLERGAVLLIVEMDESSVESIKSSLMSKHPELKAEGELGSVPPAL